MRSDGGQANCMISSSNKEEEEELTGSDGGGAGDADVACLWWLLLLLLIVVKEAKIQDDSEMDRCRLLPLLVAPTLVRCCCCCCCCCLAAGSCSTLKGEHCCLHACRNMDLRGEAVTLGGLRIRWWLSSKGSLWHHRSSGWCLLFAMCTVCCCFVNDRKVRISISKKEKPIKYAIGTYFIC